MLTTMLMIVYAQALVPPPPQPVNDDIKKPEMEEYCRLVGPISAPKRICYLVPKRQIPVPK